MTPSDLAALDLRRDLDRVRRSLAEAVSIEDARALMDALAARDAVALADVLVGPAACRGALPVRALCGSSGALAALEAKVRPTGLYRRLVELAGDPATAIEVLETAAERHPAAAWLVELSRRVEVETETGLRHLRAASRHPAFAAACWAHAAAGHRAGLVAAAGETGRAEPAAALLSLGANDEAIEAAARALDRDPCAPVLQFLAAIWGPDIDALAARLVPRIRSAAAARALSAAAAGCPRTSALLRAVLPAVGALG